MPLLLLLEHKQYSMRQRTMKGVYAKVLRLRVRVVHDRLSPMRQPASLIRSVIGESFLITPSTRHMHRFCNEMVTRAAIVHLGRTVAVLDYS